MARRQRRFGRRPWLEWPLSHAEYPAAGSGQIHARHAWQRLAAITKGLSVAPRSVDGDLEFLKSLARHVVGCPQCRTRYPDGRPEDWLWRAVRADRGLRQLAEPLDRAGDGGG